MNDYRPQLCCGLPPRAGKRARKRKSELSVPPSQLAGKASIRERSSTMTTRTLSRREQPVEERQLQLSRRLGGVLGEAKPPLVEEQQRCDDCRTPRLAEFRERGQLCCPNENRTVQGGRVPRQYSPGGTEPHTLRYPGCHAPWVHAHEAPLSYTTVYTLRVSAEEQAPGLRGLFRAVPKSSSRTTSAASFPYLRSTSPGHSDRQLAIWDKCWIASRSQPAWAGWAGEPWRVLGGPPRASWEAPGPRIRAPGTRIQGAWDPWIRGSWDPDPG